MSIRVGVVSAAHVHAPSFVSCFQNDARSEVVGVWDDDSGRGRAFGEARGVKFVDSLPSLMGDCDAVVICSENMKHVDQISMAAELRTHLLCEKPIAPVEDHVGAIRDALAGRATISMTAFPCPFSPTFAALKSRVNGGEIGEVLAVAGTNQGTCPGGWFTEPSLSGGGAMIDHVVHVADLLRRLLGEDPEAVQAQTGTNMYGEAWDDTAMVTVHFPSGRFATIDSSWSKPEGYKTWGNVKLNVVGSKGVVEADLFSQGLDVYRKDGVGVAGSGSNLDALMVGEFLSAIEENREALVSIEDGLWASRVAIAAYRSVNSGGELAGV